MDRGHAVELWYDDTSGAPLADGDIAVWNASTQRFEPAQPSVSSGASVLSKVTIDIDAAALTTIGTTPVELVPAPAAGSVLIPTTIVISYLAGATPYTNSPDLYVDWADSTLGQAGGAVGLDATDDQMMYAAVSSESAMDPANADGKALVLNGSGIDPDGDGDGTLKVTLTYFTAPVA